MSVFLEFYKLRRRKIWLVLLSFVCFLAIWILFNIRNPDEDELRSGWVFLIYTAPLIQSIIAPVLLSVLASRISDIEWKGNTWKVLKTLQQPGRLFCSKFLCGSIYVAVYILLCYIAMLMIGIYMSFYGTPHPIQYLLSLTFNFVTCEVVFLFQLNLSLCVRNQMVPLIAGLLSAFIGLFLLYLPSSFLNLLLPWGGFSTMMLVGMDWSPETRIIHYFNVSPNWIAFLCAIIWCFILFAIGYLIFSRKEV